MANAESKVALIKHLKAVAEKAKQYAGEHIAALAQATTDAIEEMDLAKADKPEYVAFTIPATGWQTDSSVPGYQKYLDVQITGLTADDRVAVEVAPESTAVARAADFTSTQALAGKLRLRAANVPTFQISAQYHIIKEVSK